MQLAYPMLYHANGMRSTFREIGSFSITLWLQIFYEYVGKANLLIMDKQKRVGIWIRVSTERQVEDESPEHHEMRGRYYAETRNWQVVEVYRLEAVSGKSVIDHPEAKRMIKDIRSGHISTLIFSKLARLARNTRELLDFAGIFRECNADLVSLAESIDTSTPAGRMFYTFFSALAEWERDEIASRVLASVPIRAKLGKSLGGAASFGYKWENNQLVIDETEAPVRKLIYELFLKLRRKNTTANELNRLGYRTRNGSKFSDNTVSRLLHDPTAKGQRIANYTKSKGEGKGYTIKPESEWVVVPCPAIVSEELWNQCSQVLKEQEKKYRKLGRSVIYLLSGYINCSCGTKMYIEHANATYRCRKCKGKILAADLDEIYHDQLKYFLIPENKEAYTDQYQTTLREKKALFATSKQQQEKLQKLSQKWLDLRIAEEIDPETFAKQHKPIEVQLRQYAEQIPRLESDIDILSVQSVSSEIVLEEARNLYQQWSELPFEKRRAVVETITENITVGDGDISIRYSYLSQSAVNVDAGMSLRLLQPSR